MNSQTSTLSGISEVEIPSAPTSQELPWGLEDPALPPWKGPLTPTAIDTFAAAVRAAGLLVGVDLPRGDCVKAALDTLRTSAERDPAADAGPDSALTAFLAALEDAG
jgi:hypothetical protein